MTTKYKQREAERIKKRRERKKTQKELDKTFPGYAQLKSLSRGVYEEAENDEEGNGEETESSAKVSKKNDKSSEKVQQKDDEGFPESWAKIASQDEKTREKIRVKIAETNQRRDQILSELREKAKKGKKKTGKCIGNKYHRGGSESGEGKNAGQFSSKEDAGSASIRKKNNTDCKPGTFRMPGNKFIKNPHKCGREGEYKCSTDDKKDGYRKNKVKEEFRKSLEKVYEEDRGVFELIKHIFEESADEVSIQEAPDEKREREMSYCRKKYGLRTMKEYLQLINSIEAASKGNLNKPQK